MIAVGTLEARELMTGARTFACRMDEPGNNLAESDSKVKRVWQSYGSRLPKCNGFKVYGLFGRDRFVALVWSR